jgi:hypothetical protein
VLVSHPALPCPPSPPPRPPRTAHRAPRLKCESEPVPALHAAPLQWRAWPTSSLAPLVLPACGLVGAGQSVPSLPTTPGCGKERKSHSTTALGPVSARLHDAALVETCIRCAPWSAALAAHQTATCRTRDRDTTRPCPPEPGHCWPGCFARQPQINATLDPCHGAMPLLPLLPLVSAPRRLGHAWATHKPHEPSTIPIPPTVANMPVALDTRDSLLTKPPSAYSTIHQATARTCLLAPPPLDPVNRTSSVLSSLAR